MKDFSIIVAFDSQYGIGKNGQLAWKLSQDLKHFKEITLNHRDPLLKNAVIMGRKTWESLPEKFRPLPNRVNVILSQSGLKDLPEGVLCFQILDDALKQLTHSAIESVFVIGGAQIYAHALYHPGCQKLYVTHVKGQHGCDVFFPPISGRFITISASEAITENEITFHFSEYLRLP